jgi:glycosyltransferase involved in cell wall biosynthesis
LVLSSSHAVAKGVLTGPDQLHICMCYSPIRYAWDFQHQYLRESGMERGLKTWFARWILHKIRIWDTRTANGVDEFIAISHFIQRRIKKAYGRSSTVIYPPVDINFFAVQDQKNNYYVTASRMVPYKRVDLIVEAFSKMPEHRLVVVGDGPDFDRISLRAGPNVELVGFQSAEKLKHYVQNAKAFVFAAEEDFGIAPIEAQACGTPVIAYGRGATLETIRGLGREQIDGFTDATGVFFPEQTVESLIAAIRFFEEQQQSIKPAACRANAARFSTERFNMEFRDFVLSKIDDGLQKSSYI